MADRLGVAPPTPRALIVVADDFGLTPATSATILRCHRDGIVTATSVLGNGPSTDADLGPLAEAPSLEVGLHLALVGEDPPRSPARSIPTLVDRHGRLARSWRHLVPRLAARRVDPDDVARELDAQLAPLLDRGIRPTHLNAHQHLHLWPTIAEVLVEAASRHGIGYVRTPTASGARRVGVAPLAARLRSRIHRASLATSDAFLGLDEAGRWSTAQLVAAARTVEHPVTELNVHPGAEHDPERNRYRWGYRWPDEAAALVDPEVRRAVDAAGLTLAGPAAAIALGGPSATA